MPRLSCRADPAVSDIRKIRRARSPSSPLYTVHAQVALLLLQAPPGRFRIQLRPMRNDDLRPPCAEGKPEQLPRRNLAFRHAIQAIPNPERLDVHVGSALIGICPRGRLADRAITRNSRQLADFPRFLRLCVVDYQLWFEFVHAAIICLITKP